MVNRLTIVCLVLLSAVLTGCQWPRGSRGVSAARVSEPPLPADMTTHQLVSFLNSQSEDLNGWRSTSTKMEVRVPNIFPQRLSGAIACQSPNYFRLTASNFAATTDLGSNNHRCWAYVKPGEGAVMTWSHEDTAMLQQVPTGVPYIDPNWLMLVLGITPLDESDYQVRPAGGKQLWLESISEAPSGRPLRRVIKVDRVHRVVREHMIADSEANVLVSAELSNHRWANNRLIPHSVRLHFPQMRTEIRLTFSDIETNPDMPDSLWHLPDNNLRVVDLGQMVRQKLAAQYPELNQFSEVSTPEPPESFQTLDQNFQTAEVVRPPFSEYAESVHGNQSADFQPPISNVDSADSEFFTPRGVHGFEEQPSTGFDANEEIPEPEWSASAISFESAAEESTRQESRPAKRRFFGLFPG